MVRIEPLGDDATPAALAGIERIFFAASLRKTFADAAEREAFKERWLGRYLLHDCTHAFVACTPDGGIAGYLLGCLEDPALAPRFQDLTYFADFADLTARYPAHLHVNLDAARRSQGIGTRLMERFTCHAARHGAPGVHIVTGAGVRNVKFYERAGFVPLRELPWNGGRVLMMGRDLDTKSGAS
jgi:GNAT superfamily N-acetyltransferase